VPANAQPAPSPPAVDSGHLAGLETLLGHAFQNRALISQAVTHSSLAYERASTDSTSSPTATLAAQAPPDADNEQLEFLGDAVVGLLVAELLCKQCPTLKEGQLTRLRAALVSRRHLGEVAARLGLGQYLRLGRGEERSGGRKKNAILANTIEAVIGALYLDAGLGPVRLFVQREIIAPSLSGLLEQMEEGSTIDDHKSALQEFLQAMRLGPPIYTVKSESGPDHLKRFVVEVRVSGTENPNDPMASGQGATKKRAEQEAAHRALQRLSAKQHSDPHLAPNSAKAPSPKEGSTNSPGNPPTIADSRAIAPRGHSLKSPRGQKA
jgi:ribonuclease III